MSFFFGQYFHRKIQSVHGETNMENYCYQNCTIGIMIKCIIYQDNLWRVVYNLWSTGRLSVFVNDSNSEYVQHGASKYTFYVLLLLKILLIYINITPIVGSKSILLINSCFKVDMEYIIYLIIRCQNEPMKLFIGWIGVPLPIKYLRFSSSSMLS